MTQDADTETELRRVERAVSALNDAVSHEAVRRYLKDLEYDLAYRAPDRGPVVTI